MELANTVKLEEDKNAIEDAILDLQTIMQRRIRMEAELEAELRQLKKLGYASLREATMAYRKSVVAITAEVEELNTGITAFMEEFQKVTTEMEEE